ncbi:MAG: rod shape-determining protein RodA [Anaerolineae bacterium]|nr:rod shape-determining protein RodA [Anaerolineae bacterium]
MRTTETSIWRQFDYLLLTAVTLLVIFGILMIRSATMDAVDTDLINRVPRQIQYGLAGLVVVFLFTAIDYRLLGALHWWIYLFVLLFLGLVTFFGLVGAAGAQRWLDVGIPIQPSEISKVLLVITLAQHLSKNVGRFGELKTVLISLVYIGIPALFVFLQPSLGVTIVIMVTWAGMVWGAGLRLKHIGLFALVLLLLAPVVWTNMEAYQQQRIINFINPEADPDGQYNIQQALITIGSGGVLGKGYAQGTQTQLRFLRVRHTDFIFSVIAEEFGFIGAVLTLFLMGIVLWRILRGARLAGDALGSLICYGVATLIFFQTFVSVGMNLNMLPVTGLTLPFISSGGSSLLTLLLGIGLVESVIVRRPQR